MHVIGTAGHVDHGKSTLVQTLTGIDPDRLAEEKEREMTIDLGFAWLTLGGEEIGIVDVPGHRDFIENMLAGVGGIDLTLFVIAADEGVMPQTREHLAILDLLEIKRGVVALTKSDLIDDPEWLELVTLEVSDVLEGTTLAGAPVVPVSARTGAGIDALKKALEVTLREIGEPPDWHRPRLPIDRVFSLPGFGTIVTGTLLDGSFHIGDEVEIMPGGIPGRIRGLQTHKAKRETARPGSRVAINLSGIDRDQLQRGQVVAKRGLLKNTQLLDVHYRHLPETEDPLHHNAEVKVFLGSAEITAHARVIGQEQIQPGTEGWLQLALTTPAAAARGDRFILRRPSPGATIGGGRVLDPHPGRRHRRFRPNVLERFQIMAQGTPEELLLRTLTLQGPLSPAKLFEKAGLSAEDALVPWQSLLQQDLVIDLGKTAIAAAAWEELVERIPRELATYHRELPLKLGIDREELRSRMQIQPAVFAPLREKLALEGKLEQAGTLLRLPEHRVQFSPEDEKAIVQLMTLFEAQKTSSPSVKECQAIVGEAVYFALVDMGRIKPVAEDVVYSAETYTELITRLSDYLHQRGSITAAEARDLLGASRKYAIALLEHMDERRITRRVGDVRVPARPPLPIDAKPPV
jgi:selenocysteine-specific elongation factor